MEKEAAVIEAKPPRLPPQNIIHMSHYSWIKDTHTQPTHTSLIHAHKNMLSNKNRHVCAVAHMGKFSWSNNSSMSLFQ